MVIQAGDHSLMSYGREVLISQDDESTDKLCENDRSKLSVSTICQGV